MSSSSTHWDQAEHNKRLSCRLLSASPIEFKDWVCTTAFYAAIHYVEASLAAKEPAIHSDGKKNPHDFRKQQVDEHLKCLSVHYRHLRTVSTVSRYLEGREEIAGAWLDDSAVESIVNTRLEAIRGHVAQVLDRVHARGLVPS